MRSLGNFLLTRCSGEVVLDSWKKKNQSNSFWTSCITIYSMCIQGWLQGYVIGGGGKRKFDQLVSVDVEVWPTWIGQCWGLTNSSRSMLRFGQLESVNIEVWPTRGGQCWGLTDSNQSMLRYDQLESVNIEVWPIRISQCWGMTNSSRSMLRFDQLEFFY